MDEHDWLGLTVRSSDGRVVGVVVGVFAQGLLAGRLRVQGPYAPIGRGMPFGHGAAVYAIPRHVVVRRRQDSLVLGVTLGEVRHRWQSSYWR